MNWVILSISINGRLFHLEFVSSLINKARSLTCSCVNPIELDWRCFAISTHFNVSEISKEQHISIQTENIPASFCKPVWNFDGGVLMTDGSCANRDVSHLTSNFKITAPTKPESSKRDLLIAGQLGKTEGLSPTSPPNAVEGPLKSNGEDVA